jgi:hypothetical protein
MADYTQRLDTAITNLEAAADVAVEAINELQDAVQQSFVLIADLNGRVTDLLHRVEMLETSKMVP